MQTEHSIESGLSPTSAYIDSCESVEKDNGPYANVDGEQFNSCESNSSEQNDKMFLSTETLIDNADKLELDTRLNQQERYRNLSGSSPNVTSSRPDTSTYLAAKVASGLLMSPTSLSQEVHVTVGEDKQRMSAVLDSLDLHLVYLPTTQQLVAANTLKDDVNDTGCNIVPNKDTGENCDQNNESGYFNSNSTNFLRPSVQISEPPDEATKMETSSVKHIHVRTPSNADDVLSISESDCSMHTAEPNDDFCDNSNFLSNFPRINTNDSLLRTFTDASSLSSLSTGTDFSVSAASLDDGEGTGHCIDTGDGGFIEISLNSKNSFEKGKNPSEDSGFEDRNIKPKRKGLSSLLSRGLFSRKQKYSVSEEEQPGWKLFGKVPPREPSSKPHSPSPSENEGDEQSSSQTKRNDVEIASTTALILQNRPSNLPCKSPEEQERHQRQYEAMVEAARKREQKKLKQKKRMMQRQLKQEEQLLAAAKIWNVEIIPNWETMKTSRKARELWWHGIPTNVRGKVWRMALGNDLNITSELYEICVSRAADKIRKMDESPVLFGKQDGVEEPPSSNRESSVELIKLDISRTFPQLCIFQKGGPYHDLLHSLLGAYACYRPDIGYVQGMSFIAAVLLLNMDVADAFICFANLLNQPCQLAFFRVDKQMMNVYIETYEEFFRENMPTLQSHFQQNNLTPDLYLYDWIFTIYSKSLPLDVACRVWDIFCRDGEEFLFRTALGILKYFEDILMQMDFFHLAQFLTKLPDKDSYEGLFQSIECIQMLIDKKRFLNVLALVKDNKEKDVT